MITLNDPVWIQQRIDNAKATILAIETAITTLTVGGVKSYSLNTGQTQQTVTRSDLGDLQKMLTYWNGVLVDLDQQLNGSGRVTRVIPGF